MNLRWKAITAAFVTAGVVTLVGLLYLFDPIAKMDGTSEPLVSPAVNFIVYVVLFIALFDWAAQQIRSACKAAFIIAASQFLLVNVDFVLSGKRGLMTAAASTILLALTWGSVAFAYSFFVKFKKRDQGTPGKGQDE